jgi:hypothetical protein
MLVKLVLLIRPMQIKLIQYLNGKQLELIPPELDVDMNQNLQEKTQHLEMFFACYSLKKNDYFVNPQEYCSLFQKMFKLKGKKYMGRLF